MSWFKKFAVTAAGVAMFAIPAVSQACPRGGASVSFGYENPYPQYYAPPVQVRPAWGRFREPRWEKREVRREVRREEHREVRNGRRGEFRRW